jgi:hypothetical protein
VFAVEQARAADEDSLHGGDAYFPAGADAGFDATAGALAAGAVAAAAGEEAAGAGPDAAGLGGVIGTWPPTPIEMPPGNGNAMPMPTDVQAANGVAAPTAAAATASARRQRPRFMRPP